MCVREKWQSSVKEKRAFVLPEAVSIARLFSTSSSDRSAATFQNTFSGNEHDATLFSLIHAHGWNGYFWISVIRRTVQPNDVFKDPAWVISTALVVKEQRNSRYHFYFEFYLRCNLVYLHTERLIFFKQEARFLKTKAWFWDVLQL